MKNRNTKNENKTWTIYKHTCRVNGFSYIGQTAHSSPEARWGRGGRYYKKQTAFWAAIQEFGWENFDHEILATGIKTLKEANRLEKHYIAYYHTWIGAPDCKGYNAMRGGANSWYIASDATREKMRQAKLGLKHSDEYKATLSEAVGGQKIICIETQQVYLGKNEAERQTKIRHIGECCHHQREVAGGYHWAFINDIEWQNKFKEFIGKDQHITKFAKRTVLCIETGEVFESVYAAKRKYKGNIDAVVLGKRETAAGYHWKYIDDNN